jgi:hypothetical protein
MPETSAQLREQLADCRTELEDLRDEVLEGMRAMKTAIRQASNAVVQLQTERVDYERERSMLRQSLKDKEHVEKELRETLKASTASTPHQARASPSSLRVLEEKDIIINSMQIEIDSLSSAVERAHLDAARSASMAVVQGRGSVSPGETLTLTAQLEARAAEVAQLQTATETQAKSHQLRIAELQECFQAKIRELRRGHEHQLGTLQQEIGKDKGVNQKGLVRKGRGFFLLLSGFSCYLLLSFE